MALAGRSLMNNEDTVVPASRSSGSSRHKNVFCAVTGESTNGLSTSFQGLAS